MFGSEQRQAVSWVCETGSTRWSSALREMENASAERPMQRVFRAFEDSADLPSPRPPVATTFTPNIGSRTEIRLPLVRGSILTSELVMNVRALGGIVVGAGRFLRNFHVKTYRKSLGREALGVVAGLVAKDAVHHIFPRNYGVQRMYG